jgi:hypothetical protein
MGYIQLTTRIPRIYKTMDKGVPSHTKTNRHHSRMGKQKKYFSYSTNIRKPLPKILRYDNLDQKRFTAKHHTQRFIRIY